MSNEPSVVLKSITARIAVVDVARIMQLKEETGAKSESDVIRELISEALNNRIAALTSEKWTKWAQDEMLLAELRRVKKRSVERRSFLSRLFRRKK